MYFKYQGIKMFYEKYGEKNESIIILPGWGNTRQTWSNFINHYKADFSIYIVDYPGFGNSLFPNHDMTLFDYTIIIREWISFLNLNDPIIIGHSFGGRILSLILGYYKDNYSKTIFVDSAGLLPKKTFKSLARKSKYKFLKNLSKMFPKHLRKKYLKYLFNKYSSIDYKSLPSFMHNTFKNIVNLDLSYYVKQIKNESLLLWGENDLDTPLFNAYKFNTFIEKSILKIIPNAGHFSYLDNFDLFCVFINCYIKKES